jgi:hypothetical protein
MLNILVSHSKQLSAQQQQLSNVLFHKPHPDEQQRSHVFVRQRSPREFLVCAASRSIGGLRIALLLLWVIVDFVKERKKKETLLKSQRTHDNHTKFNIKV